MTHLNGWAENWNGLERRAPNGLDHSLRECPDLSVIGDWKNYFTEEQNRAFNKLYNEKMQGSGLEFIFDPEEIDTRNKDEGEVTTTNLEN
ncbi:hypothetical protein AVEN_270915-1 [Araneus ventricosus]|uniref:Sulfotransferase domain-containing protein n=1 Tax=Araneus ventricosus TaxID=182803 RepID=A0A4Y2WMF8_ARAVE|nr:hypothetical protein AVEN_270915-1 [Araneus ventricosus]